MKIKGVEILDIEYSQDIRGESYRIYECIEDFDISEIYISISNKDVIRGMHFQPYPYGQKKIISILEGRIEGVVLDLRQTSDTYLMTEHVELEEKSRYSIVVPEYCAWGFHAKESRNIIVYNISGQYIKEADMGIRWDSVGYDWKVKKPVISERDKKLITLDEFVRRQR